MNEESHSSSRPGYGDWDHCQRKLAGRGVGWFGRFLTWLLAKLDFALRTRDFEFHRSYGGWLDRRLGLDGHAPIVILLPALLAIFVVFGPRLPLPWHDIPPGIGIGIASVAVAWTFLIAGTFLFREKRTFWFQIVWMLGLCGLLWWVAGPDRTAATHAIHRHVLLVFIPAVIVPTAVLAKLLAWLLVRRLRDDRKADFRERLRSTELFQSPDYPEISFLGLLRGFFSVPLYSLLSFLWLPAFLLIAVFQPGAPVFAKTLVAAAVWLAILTLLVFHPRLDAVNVMLRRSLFTGGQLVVSIVVIVLGLGRLFDIQYVSTVIDSRYQLPLVLIIACAYAYFWFFEYWINRVVCEELIGILHDATKATRERQQSGKIGYPIENSKIATSVSKENRVLQIHGGARFVAVGINRYSGKENFQFYEKLQLFQHLVATASGDQKTRALEAMADLSARMRFYFSSLNLLILTGFVLLIWIFFAGPQVAEQRISEAGTADLASLKQLIYENKDDGDVILLAASGGGTRAALYTVGVLNGLRERGWLGQLKLASGVSGGGATLAYFSGQRDALLNDDMAAWEGMQCTMDDPFVWDVLDGVAEWRIFAETGLGQLLAESFVRRFDDGGKSLHSIGRDFTLILNTALAGSQMTECGENESHGCGCKDGESFPDCAHRLRARTRGVVSGGRLIFTNSDSAGAFPGLEGLAPPAPGMNYVAIQDPAVQLTTAAALNANFPPVFPNAAVDLEDKKIRFWVTDGGAVENRGILSLLFALRDAVLTNADADVWSPELPRRIHIVVAEASAGGTGYSKFPGVSSKFGAPAQLGSQLMLELLEEIKDELERIGGKPARERIDIHYLGMPGPLRIDGGLGTHWMLARDVRLGDPAECNPGDRRDTLQVSGLAVRNAIYGLFLEDRSTAQNLSCPDDAWDAEGRQEVQQIWDLIGEGGGACWQETALDGWNSLVEHMQGPEAHATQQEYDTDLR